MRIERRGRGRGRCTSGKREDKQKRGGCCPSPRTDVRTASVRPSFTNFQELHGSVGYRGIVSRDKHSNRAALVRHNDCDDFPAGQGRGACRTSIKVLGCARAKGCGGQTRVSARAVSVKAHQPPKRAHHPPEGVATPCPQSMSATFGLARVAQARPCRRQPGSGQTNIATTASSAPCMPMIPACPTRPARPACREPGEVAARISGSTDGVGPATAPGTPPFPTGTLTVPGPHTRSFIEPLT